MKLAKDFGFSTANSGNANSAALQNAVLGGGDVYISEPGIYEIAEQIVLDDNTSLYFCAGAKLKRVDNPGRNGYVFTNRAALGGKDSQNIKIDGLHLICNGVVSCDKSDKNPDVVLGLRGHLSFFHIRNLTISNFECYDLPTKDFGIHVCAFENVLIENVRIEGMKDAVHFGRGSKFVVRHGLFRTFDDPIALNGHDYVNSNPELGWIENGLIEDCYDLNAESTTGYFCRILAGAWTDWYEGMTVQRSDTVVSDNRLYRVYMPADGATYRSVTRPTHTSGEQEYDGIVWAVIQEGATYGAGCRNIHFKDIYLQKDRSIAFSIHFDKDKFSRSYYPGAKSPVQENLTFENIVVESDKISSLLCSLSPVDNVRFINCTVKNNRIIFGNIREEGIEYPTANILMSGTKFKEAVPNLIKCDAGVSANLCVSDTMNPEFPTTAVGDVFIKSSDIQIDSIT